MPNRTLTGKEVRHWRRSLNMNQADFWRRVFVTQSGGSRHESAGYLPEHIDCLLRLIYCSEKEALAQLAIIRKTK
jgi:DNA-binding transcriptional regulator YiaG